MVYLEVTHTKKQLTSTVTATKILTTIQHKNEKRIYKCRNKTVTKSTQKNREHQSRNKSFSGYTWLPYLRNISNRIGRLQTHHNIKAFFKPTQEFQNILRSAENSQELKKYPAEDEDGSWIDLNFSI